LDVHSAGQLLQDWVRDLQDVRLDLIKDKRLRGAVKRWLRQRPGTNFQRWIEMHRILALIVVPLVEARRRRDKDFIDALGKLLASSEPASTTNYSATTRQKPVHPGLFAAVGLWLAAPEELSRWNT
jgi:hypothetical protein